MSRGKLIHWWLGAAFFLFFSLPVSASADSQPSKQALRDAHLSRYMLQPKVALDFVDSLIEAHTNNEELWELKAELHMLNMAEVNMFRKPGQIRQSLAAYERAAEINPTAFRAQGLLYTLYEVLPGVLGGDKDKAQTKGQELKAMGDGVYPFALALKALTEDKPELHVKYLRQAVTEAPEIVDYHIALARSLMEIGEWEAAEETLQIALANHPDHQPLTYQYARFYLLQNQAPSNVMQILNELLEREQYAPVRFLTESVYLLRGRAHQLNGDLQRARMDFEYVSRRAPRLIDEMDFAEYVAQVIKSSL